MSNFHINNENLFNKYRNFNITLNVYQSFLEMALGYCILLKTVF